MQENIVKLQDIWYTGEDQEIYCCHAFGIYDDENVLLAKLHFDVNNHQPNHPNKQEILDTLLERFQIVANNREYFAVHHEKKRSEIKVRHHLTRMIEFGGKVYQFLTSDITVTLSDCKTRYVQPPLCFLIGEDFKTWTAIVQLDDSQSEKCDDVSGLREVIQGILLQRSLNQKNPQSSQPTTPSEFSV